jgi:hypothetical protein
MLTQLDTAGVTFDLALSDEQQQLRGVVEACCAEAARQRWSARPRWPASQKTSGKSCASSGSSR